MEPEGQLTHSQRWTTCSSYEPN